MAKSRNRKHIIETDDKSLARLFLWAMFALMINVIAFGFIVAPVLLQSGFSNENYQTFTNSTGYFRVQQIPTFADITELFIRLLAFFAIALISILMRPKMKWKSKVK